MVIAKTREAVLALDGAEMTRAVVAVVELNVAPPLICGLCPTVVPEPVELVKVCVVLVKLPL